MLYARGGEAVAAWSGGGSTAGRGRAAPAVVARPEPEPERELHVAIPPGCCCVGLRFYVGRAGRGYAAGPGETVKRVVPGLHVVISFPLGAGREESPA